MYPKACHPNDKKQQFAFCAQAAFFFFFYPILWDADANNYSEATYDINLYLYSIPLGYLGTP